MGIPFQMVKIDSHMLKVKGKLLSERKRIEDADERKKAREAKKISKEVQAQKNKNRAKRQKDDIESVKKWRKQRQQSRFPKGDDEEMGLNFDDEKSFEGSKKKRPGVAPGDRSGGKKWQGKGWHGEQQKEGVEGNQIWIRWPQRYEEPWR